MYDFSYLEYYKMQDNMLNLKIGICNGSTETENFIERMVCKKRKMSGITIQINIFSLKDLIRNNINECDIIFLDLKSEEDIARAVAAHNKSKQKKILIAIAADDGHAQELIELAIIDSLQPDAVFDMPLEFTLNEEKEIVKQYISPSIEVDSAPNTEELWKMVIGYFKKNTHSYERFINGFGDLSFVLQEADPVECIKHFNLFRTLSSAQSKYKMGNESYDIPVVLVKAEKSYINMDLEVWNTLFPNNQMLMYPVNHNQIIQEPVASEWINNLNQVI